MLKQYKEILIYIGLYIATISMVLSTVIIPPYEHNNFPLLRLIIITFAGILLAKYFVYMIVSPWYDVLVVWERKRRTKAGISAESYKPKVSVIIPAWNEAVGLLSTVKTVLMSTYKNLEIVVINDGSTDTSDALMTEFLDTYDNEHATDPDKRQILYRYKKNGGKGRALNNGIILSTGEIVISIDADCVLMPDTVANFVRYFENPAVMAAVGNVKIGNTEHILGTLQYLEFLFAFYFKKADSLFNTIYIIGGAAGAFRREVFTSIGLYSQQNITEDIDLSVRIQEAGMKIVYAADAIVFTEGASTLDGLSKQRLRWKQGRFQTFSDHRALFFSTKNRHNKILTWLILPFAVFGDTQLFFEVFFLLFLYIYSFITHDFSSFLSGIFVVSAMFVVQLFDDDSKGKVKMYFLAPIGWLLFYITTTVEYRALIRSIWGMITKKNPVWQRWQRRGLEEAVATEILPSNLPKEP